MSKHGRMENQADLQRERFIALVGCAAQSHMTIFPIAIQKKCPTSNEAGRVC